MVRMRVITILLALFIAISGMNIVLDLSSDHRAVSGAPIYVGSGSTYSTIQDAVDNAADGDFIFVANGSYSEQVQVNVANLTIIGNSTDNCKAGLNHNGGSLSDFAAVFNVTATGVTIAGFYIATNGNYAIGIYLDSTYGNFAANNFSTDGGWCYGIYMVGATNNNIKSNVIVTQGASSHGVYLKASSQYNDVEGNIIFTAADDSIGIQVYQSMNVDVIGNTVSTSGLDAYGIQIEQSRYNKIWNNTVDTTNSDSDAIRFWQVSHDGQIVNNTVTTSGDTGIGIVASNSNTLEVFNNTINVSGPVATGLFIAQCSNSTFINNSVTTTGSAGYAFRNYQSNDNHWEWNSANTSLNSGIGIELSTSYNVEFTNNTILTQGPSADGITVSSTAKYNTIQHNNITTSGTGSSGIQMTQKANNNKIINNTIKTDEINTDGMYIQQSSNNLILDNDINTSKTNSHGMYIYNTANNNRVINNTIETTGQDANGIWFALTNNNTAIDNNVKTSSSGSNGIYLSETTNSSIKNNTFTTVSGQAYGIALMIDSLNNTVIGNTVTTYGDDGVGIYTSGTSGENRIIGNDIKTNALSSYGIDLSGSFNNTARGNTINTTRDSSPGILLEPGAINNRLIDNTIYTYGSWAYGVFIQSSNRTVTINNSINAMGSNTWGYRHDGVNSPVHVSTVINSTINTPNGKDFYLAQEVNVTSINNIFNTVDLTNDGGGVLQVYNYLSVQAYYQGGSVPIPGADVEIIDNSMSVYASSGYGGSDAQTPGDGRVDLILIADRFYYESDTPVENATTVKVKKTIDITWEEVRSSVDMNGTHTEVFTAADMIVPAVPTGLTISRVGTTTTLNISWNANVDVDIAKYTVYSNRSGSWQQVAEKDHPDIWFEDPGLTEGTTYYYRVRAMDTSNLPSVNTTIASYYLSDITPPAIPSNFNVVPVVGGDAMRASWDLNPDDTVRYELLVGDSPTGPFGLAENISHPQNAVSGGEGDLVNGTTYYFKLRAWDEVGNPSGFTTVVSVVHRDYKAPEAPVILTVETISEYEIDLSWSASSDPDLEGYRLYMNASGAGSSGPYVLVQEYGNAVFTQLLSGLSENTTYYFVVDSFDEANNANRSNEGSNTTDAAIIIITPPGKPTLDPVPEYTNKVMFNITGLADAAIEVLVYRNATLSGTTTSDGVGDFWVEVELDEGLNTITARARKAGSVFGEYSDALSIILDTQDPAANAGADVEIKVGDSVSFNGTGSSDNYGIVNYTWSFDDGTRATVRIYGDTAEQKFDTEGVYEVALTVLDVAGNSGTDSMKVTVTTGIVLERPKVVSTDPVHEATGVPLGTAITITFSMSMDTVSVQNMFDMEPKLLFDINWSANDTVFRLDFRSDLEYNTTHNITIGNAKAMNGEILEGAPFLLSFTTEAEEIIPITPSISITPLPEPDYGPGETITISGTTTAIDAGTNVTVTVNGETTTGTVGADGSWSVTVTLPEEEGTHTITVTVGDETTTGTVKVESADKKSKEDESNNMMLFLLLAVVVIIIIVVVVMMMRKKKPSEEMVEEMEEREEMEDDEEPEEEDEVEETEEEEEAEDEEESEEVGEEESGLIGGQADRLTGSDEAEEEIAEDDEDIEDFEDEPEVLKTVSCPKCDTDIDVEETDGAKVSLECTNCGAKGRIKNPYL